MKIVEPQVAMALLHRKPEQIPPIMPAGGASGLGQMMRPPMIGQQQNLIQTLPLMQPVSMNAPPPIHVPIQPTS